MEFQLDRDLIFFDLETTGLSVVRDRIVQMAFIKYYADGREPKEVKMLIDPEIPISTESSSIHGITADDVRGKHTFKQVAERLMGFIGDADLAGYNSNRFDVPVLMEEFHRAGLAFSLEGRRLIDVQRIFYKMEPRTLRAALRYYTGQSLTDAHDALADVRATVEVLKGQIDRYQGADLVDEDGNVTHEPVRNDMQQLHDFTNDLRFLDATQRIRVEMDGTAVFNFGKYNGKPVGETLAKDNNYHEWIQKKEFSTQMKQIAARLRNEYMAEQLRKMG